MSFDEKQRSNYDSIPLAMYEFSLGENYWRYNSIDQDVTFQDKVYKGLSIKHSGIVQSGEVQNDDFTVSLPASEPVAQLFIATPPSEPIYLIVRKKNRFDDEAPVIGVFTVSSARRVSQVAVDIVCKTLAASLNRIGVRLSYSRGCPHALYDRGCRVNSADYATSLQITAMTGATISFSATAGFSKGYLSGGFFEFPLMQGVMERRAIEMHDTNSFVVLGTTDGLKVGDWITVYPGCDRTSLTCQQKFNNLANYGGFPHLPTKSPFDGDPIF